MEKNNFHYVNVLLEQLYGMSLENEDVEELGLLAWEHIGNRNTKLYKYQAKPNSENFITLPCNAISVEAITTCYEDWNRVTNISNNGDQRSQFIENSIEAEKPYSSSYYIPGKLIKYEQVGDTIYFSKNYGLLNILYKGVIADDEGLPELTDKEAQAIATYIAYVIKYKEGLKTNNAGIIQLANTLEQKWTKQCDQARVSRLSQNDVNQILDAKDNWNRHSYGYSYKPIP